MLTYRRLDIWFVFIAFLLSSLSQKLGFNRLCCLHFSPADFSVATKRSHFGFIILYSASSLIFSLTLRYMVKQKKKVVGKTTRASSECRKLKTELEMDNLKSAASGKRVVSAKDVFLHRVRNIKYKIKIVKFINLQTGKMTAQ